MLGKAETGGVVFVDHRSGENFDIKRNLNVCKFQCYLTQILKYSNSNAILLKLKRRWELSKSSGEAGSTCIDCGDVDEYTEK